MPFDGQARWQIDILAADKTAQAFESVERRMQSAMVTARRQADGFARLASVQPAAQADAYARLANQTARASGVAEVNRLAEQSGASLAAMYGVGATGAATLAKANEKVARSIEPFPGLYRNAEVAQNRFVQLGVTRLSSLAKGAIATTVALVAVEKVLNAGFEVGAVGDQATQFGVSANELQAFRLEAARSGVAVEQLDGAILKLTAQMAAAKGGDDDAIARFEKLGVKVLDSEGRLRRVAAVMPEVARGALAMGDEVERNGLLQEMLGKSGSRTITMMESWSRGSAAMVASAKEMNAVASGETIRAWNAVDGQLRVVEQQFKVMIATFGLPIAMAHLRHLETVLGGINTAVQGIRSGWAWMTSGVPAGDLQKRADTIMATIQAMEQGATGTVDEIGRARLRGLWAEWTRLQDDIANQQTAAYMPTITVTADKPGVDNPPGRNAGAAGAKLDLRLKELQDERAALEKALAAYDARSLETVEEIDRRLNNQVQMSKKIFDVLKDVPPNSPLAQQLTQEATAVSQLNLRLDERKRLLASAEQITAQYGDGTVVAARATEQLNRMMAAGAIDAGTYARALEATKRAAEDQERAARGAAGGVGGFVAGLEQGFADMARANSPFEVGKKMVQELSSAITNLATGAEVDFGKMARSFAAMIIQMEISAAASNLWNMIRGSGQTDQGIGGGLAGLIGGLFSGGGGGGISAVGGGFDFGAAASMPGGFMPGFASGGLPPVGSPYVVGENGPEVRVDSRPGQIFTRDQWARMNGGSQRLQVSISLDNDLLRAIVRDESGQVVATAAPRIEGRAVKRAGDQVVPITNRHEAEGGGDWRLAR